MKSKSAAKPNTYAPAACREICPFATARTSSPRARPRESSIGTTRTTSATTRRTATLKSAATRNRRAGAHRAAARSVPLSRAELRLDARHLLAHGLELGPGRLGLQHAFLVGRGIAVPGN